MEFIHPFEDGNGRMGRFWQKRLLIEETIKSNQEKYYKALADSDNTGKSTVFIEFMLEAINRSLRETIEESKPSNIDYKKRSDFALSMLDGWFDRKEYMRLNKGISTATASRDLKQLIEDGRVESSGEGRMKKYKKIV